MYQIAMNGSPVMLDLSWNTFGSEIAKIAIGHTRILVDFAEKTIYMGDKRFPWKQGNKLEVRIYVDQNAIELLSKYGSIYGAVKSEDDLLDQEIQMQLTDAMEYAAWYKTDVR